MIYLGDCEGCGGGLFLKNTSARYVNHRGEARLITERDTSRTVDRRLEGVWRETRMAWGEELCKVTFAQVWHLDCKIKRS